MVSAAGDSTANAGKDSRADRGADAQRCELNWPQHPFELVLRFGSFAD